ncbi:uncharacterized protein BKCO1_6000022 [Diplodia corticola]|uniref:Rhomboid family membrane protein n=1 Tax=Diplodia corticola TaxID=236234 RepID=A0A1J9RSH0_9PEZI|nr:uncharacterized protein BKCO1_6000022 [Diplodia corticola]OJD30469.1 hypothetical protein BKCO1_6000022 [Diplodia corticola]
MASPSEAPSAPPDVPTPATDMLPAGEREGYAKLTHRLSIWLLVVCPAIALLPPRKLDLYTAGLGGMSLVAAEHLARERTGRTILQRVSGGFDNAVQPADHMPTERARQVREMQLRAKEEREAVLRQAGQEQQERKQQAQAQAHEDKDGVLQRVWMGGETEGWRERRLKEEREAIEEGRGYGDLIMDQIWEVWNWGRGNKGDGNASDSQSGKN